MSKKYLISGEKDGVTYYYRDVDAHDRIDNTDASIKKEKEERIALDQRVTEELLLKVTEQKLQAELAKVSATIPTIDNTVVKEAVLAEVQTVLNNYGAEHQLIKNEIKKATTFFEVVDAPVGTLVDYNCKEIRIMCPENTDWEAYHLELHKNLPDNYKYIAFYSYAPDTANTYSEVVGQEYPTREIIGSKETKIPYEDNPYSGVDSFTRKYSIYYFPVAERQAGGSWLYLGTKSTREDYNGWYYSIEWYNSDDIAVKSETIRVNLSTEDNFRYIEPSYEHSVWDLVRKTLPKFEIADLPEKSIVKEREKELRIYCPENVDWTKYIHNWVDETLPNADKENYIFAHIKAFAPKEAIYFRAYRESSSVTDYSNENYFKFTGINQSIDPEDPELFGKTGYKIDEKTGEPEKNACGIDKYGRNYVSFWPAIAQKVDNTWEYSGNTSNSNHFVGYTYTFEWYNNDKELIDIDTVRFNLVKTLVDLKDMRTHMLIESQRQQ